MFDNMSTQKRVLVATVLSVLFFLGYAALFPQQIAPQKVAIETNDTADAQAAPQLATSTPTTTPASTPSSVEGNTEATLVTITAPKFIMKIDSLGRISSHKLLEKKYQGETKQPLEIITSKGFLPRPLEVRFNNTALNNEAFQKVYTASVNEGTITEETPFDLVLTQTLSGVTVTKTLRFYADGHYDFDLNLDQEKAFSVSPGFQPKADVDGFTVHGALVEQSTDILTIIEDGEANGDESFKATKLASAFDRYYATLFYTPKADMNVIIAKSPEGNEDPMLFIEGSQSMKIFGYIGPKEYKTLKAIDPLLIDAIEYGFFTFLSAPVFWVLNYIHTYVGNWGWAIVILTILMRLVLYPLSYKGMMAMQRTKEIMPQLREVQQKHKGNPQKMQAATMELYKKHNANPLGGCLPLLLQMPIFFAVYRVILNAVEMQGAEWMLWIDDLAQMDPYFILPIIMGASMWYQQHITPTNFTDPMQEKMFKFLPIIFTFFFAFFPAGLTLYWTINNLGTIAQQMLVNKQFEAYKARRDAAKEAKNG